MGLFDLFRRGKDKKALLFTDGGWNTASLVFSGHDWNTVKETKVLMCVIGNVDESTAYLEQDKAIYRGYSNVITYKTDNMSDFLNLMSDKAFDVAHIYCVMKPDGMITDKPGIELAQCLEKSGVKCVLFASDNTVESFNATFPEDQERELKTMNVVVTIERKGEYFPSFFQAVFDQMAAGETMPMAWVKIAPQHDGPWMEKLPSTIFMAHRGQLKLLA